MNILYILKLKEESLIKIGISRKGSFQWLHELMKIYKISLKDSYLISADDIRTVKGLESTIIKEYGHYKPARRLVKKYNDKEGQGLLLKWDCSEVILDLIKTQMQQNQNLGIGIVTVDRIVS